MIIRIVKLSVSPEKIEDFMGYFERVKYDIRSFQGCLHLELLRDKDNNDFIFTYSKWEQSESLESYLNSPLFKSTWAKVKPWFNGKPEAWSVEQLQEVTPQ